MKILVAIDSFKGSLSSLACGAAVKEAAHRVFSDAEVEICPLADGGEGTADALVSSLGGKMRALAVTGPLGEPITAEYGVLPEAGLAIIEMASAAGITLVEEEKRNPLLTTTYGVGEMILDAIVNQGCRKFIIGIGGSTTNDGGTGMLSALGFEFSDKNGDAIAPGAKGLSALASIRTQNACGALSECEFFVACDVENPLCGEKGCSAVYGPQKGATPEMVRDMDGWLASYAALTEKTLGVSHKNTAGAGAAGGMGFAFLSYLGGKLTPGAELVMRTSGLYEKIKDADLVITGEGRLDGQTCMGKAPIRIAEAAKAHGRCVIAFAGCVTEEAAACNQNGIDAFFPILRAPCTLAEAMDGETAYKNLSRTAEQALRLLSAAKGLR